MKLPVKVLICNNNHGAVLVTSLLILALLTAMGLSASYLSNTELIIASNLETATRSLYIAEGGLEIAKTRLNRAALNNFTVVPGTSNVSVAGFTYSSGCETDSSIPCRSVTHPLNWVDANWFEYNSDSNTCTGSSVTGLSLFPVCRKYKVGSEIALVIIQTPSWAPSNPTKIVFRSITSRHTSTSPNKSVKADFEIDFGNNLAVFQGLRSNADETKDPIDNIAEPGKPILSYLPGYEYAMGGVSNRDRVSGIYTGGSKIRVEYCTNTNLAECNGFWKNLGIPASDKKNSTFLLGPTTTVAAIASDCFYSTASADFPSLPTIVLDTQFSGYHFRIVEIPDTENCT